MAVKLVVTQRVGETTLGVSEKENFQRALLDEYFRTLPLRYAKTSLPNHSVGIRSNFLPWLDDAGLFLWEVTPAHIDRFTSHLLENVSPKTAKNYIVHIATFYDWMVCRKFDEVKKKFAVALANPVDRWNTPRTKNDEDELPELPDSEVVSFYMSKLKHEFANALDTDNTRDVLILGRQLTAENIALKAGLRVEEIANLDKEDIDLKSMVIFVREGKGEKDRIVDIPASLGPLLKWYIEQIHSIASVGLTSSASGRTPLFISEQKQRVSPKTLQHKNWSLQEDYGIPIDKRFSFHGLRRLFATNLYVDLIREGHPDPIMYIKGQLGHVYLSTTLKYCRVSQATVARNAFAAISTLKDQLQSGLESQI